MSITSVAQVRSASKSKGSARVLLLVIASHVSPDTGWAWLSFDTLAREGGLQRRRTIDLVHALEASGELEVRRGHGRGHVNFYRVSLDSALSEKVQSIPTSGAQKVQSVPIKGAILGEKKVQSAPITGPRKGAILGEKRCNSGQEKVHSVAPESKEKEKKRGHRCFSLSDEEKPEMSSPFWCDACGYCHDGGCAEG